MGLLILDHCGIIGHTYVFTYRQLWLDLFKYFAFQVKSMVKGMTIGVNEDTLGAILKASIAQFISLEITKSNSTATFGRGDASRESRSVNRYLPWLSSPPANTAAQGWIPFRILLEIVLGGIQQLCGQFLSLSNLA